MKTDMYRERLNLVVRERLEDTTGFPDWPRRTGPRPSALELLATEEASHACCAVHLGLKLIGVTVTPHPRQHYFGLAAVEPPEDGSLSAAELDDAFAVTTLAGWHAPRLQAVPGFWPSESDAEDVLKYLGHGDPETFEARLRDADHRAFRFCLRHRTAIDKFARLLGQRKTILSPEASNVISRLLDSTPAGDKGTGRSPGVQRLTFGGLAGFQRVACAMF
jgi:hypothetical protein